MKLRIKFQKTGVMKFVGHLDIMRYFQRVIRRAHVDVCYSEGFSPHQIMSFASPLGVGITSDGEYLDIEVNTCESTSAMMDAMNETMVEGMEITGIRKLPDNSKTSASIIAAGEYYLTYKDGYESPYSLEEWKTVLNNTFFDANEFVILKKTKKSEKEVDLKPLVYQLEVDELEQGIAFHMLISTGSIDNLKPELLLSSIYEKNHLEFNPLSMQIHRVDLYTRENNKFISLGEMGECI